MFEVYHLRLAYEPSGALQDLHPLAPFECIQKEASVDVRWFEWHNNSEDVVDGHGRSDDAFVQKHSSISITNLWKGQDKEATVFIDKPGPDTAAGVGAMFEDASSSSEDIGGVGIGRASDDGSERSGSVPDELDAAAEEDPSRPDVDGDCGGGGAATPDSIDGSSVSENEDPHTIVAPIEPPPPPGGRRPVVAVGPRDRNIGYEFAGGSGGLCQMYEATNCRIYVKCDNPDHDRCILTRTVAASNSTAPRKQGQGRPLGLLLLWGEWSHKVGARDDHVAAGDSAEIFLPDGDRAVARERHENIGGPSFVYFGEQLERKRRPGEPADPPHI